jgi:hypothetical protein
MRINTSQICDWQHYDFCGQPLTLRLLKRPSAETGGFGSDANAIGPSSRSAQNHDCNSKEAGTARRTLKWFNLE